MTDMVVMHVRPAALLLASLVACAPTDAKSKDFEILGDLIGKWKAGEASNLSGIACVESNGFPRHCLMIDDEAQSAQFVVLKKNSIVARSTVQLTDARFEGKPLEFDGEGVAYDDGAFYVIGSNGHPRNKKGDLSEQEIAERIRAVSVVARIQVPPVGDGTNADNWPGTSVVATPSVTLHQLMALNAALRPYVDQPLHPNGLTIEGVAIRKRRLYAGLRGPLLDGDTRAVVFRADLDGLFDGKRANPELFKLALGQGRGVRDLARYKDGFLVLAGPSEDPDKTIPIPPDAYSVFWWDDDKDPELLGNIEGMKIEKDGKDVWAKPEALLPLDGDGEKLRLLVLFDGAPADKAARVEKVKKP